jgi:hypothetical protein
MYEERFEKRHKLGLERLTGDNSGRLFANERREDDLWVYDVYEISDARDPHAVKNQVIATDYPDGGEQKVARKTLAKVLKSLGCYDSKDFADFKRYNEFCEAIGTDTITGNGEAADPTEDELLAAAKAKKIDEIAEFDASANVNAFTVNGIPMWLNHDQRSRLKASIEVCTEQTMTKYFGGVAFTYPVEVWQQMLNAVELYADTCQTVTEAHKAAVNAITTVAAVEAFDITLDYPQKLSF